MVCSVHFDELSSLFVIYASDCGCHCFLRKAYALIIFRVRLVLHF